MKDGKDCKLHNDVERVLKEFHRSRKPIGYVSFSHHSTIVFFWLCNHFKCSHFKSRHETKLQSAAGLYTHTLNQITLNWIRVDEHTRFKAIPIMELGRWSSYRKGEKSENLSVDLMTLVKTWGKLSSLSKRKAGMKQHGGSQTRQILRLEKDRTEWTQRTLHVICWRVTDPTTLAHMGDDKGDRVRLGDTRWPGAEWQARENMRCRITGIKEWSWRRRRKKRMKQRVLISYFHWAIKANTFFDV